MQKKLRSLIGFAMRAGKLISGTEQVLNSIRRGKAKLVVLAKNTSGSSTKKIKDKCDFYGVELLEIFRVEELSHMIGKTNRVVLAVTSDDFASEILKAAAAEKEVDFIE